MKFKIGDRVRVKNCFDGINLKGKIGTVIDVNFDGYDYGVEFDEHIYGGHSCHGKGKIGHCRWGYERELEPVCIKKIVITSDGKTTLARLYEGKKVVKTAEFNCPEYFENLIAELDELGKTEKPKYKEVHRKATAGEYVRLVAEYGDGTGSYGEEEYDRCGIYRVETANGLVKIRSKRGSLLSFLPQEYVVLEGYKPEAEVEKATENPFFPHLEFYDINFGKIGKETNYKDVVGRKLYTGDVVEIFVDGVSQGDTVIAEDKFGDDNEIKQFVMGIADSCNMEDGIISDGWKILKKRSYNDVKNGEKIDGIKFVTEEPHKYYNGKLVCVNDGGHPRLFHCRKNIRMC